MPKSTVKLFAILPLLGLALANFAVGACLVDVDQPCGSHQVLRGSRCECESDYGLVGNACIKCSENEVGSLDGCQCAPGFGRSNAAVPCEPTAALGEPCTVDSDCAAPAFSYCAPVAGGGYCTLPDCSASAECTNDYSCNLRGSPSFCERPPVGAGVSCQSSAECVDFEASYCETVLAHACLKNDCKADPDVCPGDWVCCDVQLIGESLCLPPAELGGAGECPGGGTLIPRVN